MHIPTTEIHWPRAWRIIPSKFPPTGLFDRVASPEDLEAVMQLEGMTNDRVREELGDLSLVPPEERIVGEGTQAIMAAFTHVKPEGSRFSDGSYGVFYASYTMETAIAESRHGREQFLRATNEQPGDIDMRVYNVRICGQPHDLRHVANSADIYQLSDYQAAQRLGAELRGQRSDGIIYHSVRDSSGINIAAFRPKILSQCTQERHLCYQWDGKHITHVYTKQMLYA